MSTPLQRQLRKAAAEDLVYEREYDDLFIYTYTQKAVRERVWNKLTRMARGLILDGQGRIVARPFDKFFNLFERNETEPKNLPAVGYCIWEKVDGSMGTIFFNPITKRWDISTKGSLHSEQADYARSELLPRYAKNLAAKMDPKNTVVTEIIYPENRIVVDYGKTTELRLLAVRNIHTGVYEHPERVMNVLGKSLGMNVPEGYGYDTKTRHPETEFPNLKMQENMEGWVVQFYDGFRVKIKNPWYLQIHKALDSKSVKHILELVEGGEWRSFWERLPKELQVDFDDLYAVVRTAIYDVELRAQDAWSLCSDNKMVAHGRDGRMGRRDFALFVTKNVEEELRPIMYSILDGHTWRHHTFNIVKKRLK